jgi:hypothetical protein
MEWSNILFPFTRAYRRPATRLLPANTSPIMAAKQETDTWVAFAGASRPRAKK